MSDNFYQTFLFCLVSILIYVSYDCIFRHLGGLSLSLTFTPKEEFSFLILAMLVVLSFLCVWK